MSTANSVRKGTKLTRQDKKALRRQEIANAQNVGSRSYSFAWHRDQKMQITGFPNGQATIEPVLDNGASIEPRRLLSALGVPTRWLGVGSAALVLVAEVLRVVLS